jgi:hypothetical protein
MRRLEGPELVGYDLVEPTLARRVRILRVPVLPPGAAGMTLGRFVLLTADDDRSGTRELIAHELVHVRQFATHGVAGFLVRYVADYVVALREHRNHRAAYLAIPAEVEARQEAARWRSDRPRW